MRIRPTDNFFFIIVRHRIVLCGLQVFERLRARLWQASNGSSTGASILFAVNFMASDASSDFVLAEQAANWPDP